MASSTTFDSIQHSDALTGVDLLGSASASSGNPSKKIKISEDTLSINSDVPNDPMLRQMMKNFEMTIPNRIRSIEEQLQDAAFRLAARASELELTICLAENRAALALDPRHLENIQKWKANIQELDEAMNKILGH